MALTLEWERRIKHWMRVMETCLYQPVGQIELSGFTTFAQLSAETVREMAFQPMPVGTAWGEKWQYAWIKGELTLPEGVRGERVVLKAGQGNESLVWLNGQIVGAFDHGHQEITLARQAEPGIHFEFLMESYAGHGPMESGGGPVPYGRETVPEPAGSQSVIKAATFGLWDEPLYQLFLDFSSLYHLRGKLDPDSLRCSEIDQALMDATLLVDLELPYMERRATVLSGLARLKPAMNAVNGSTAPTFYAFGHAHLDIAWLWPLAETERKIGRTISNQLTLMKEYPEYRFLQSQPHLYTMLHECYPGLYDEMKQAVHDGRIIPDGAMWVEADTNITSGESLIRQIMYGRRFFQDEFGVNSRVLWLPDVFGYSGALPQILTGCGILGFATQKINWAYNGGDPFPYNTFVWEGIDGSETLAHIFNDYNNFPRPDQLLQRWNERHQKNSVRALMLPFGHGDGGGGVTRDHLEYLRRTRDLEGAPRTRMSSPAEFFEDLSHEGRPQNRYVGELYFQCHRGTYTSQALTKKGNRRSEFAMREAELWATAARALSGYNFGPRTLEQVWQMLLLNQFHDILPGSSIHRVYDEANASFDVVTQAGMKTALAAAQSVSGADGAAGANALTVFNSLSWPRRLLVDAPSGFKGQTQAMDGRTVTEVTVPACGWTTLDAVSQTSSKDDVSVFIDSSRNHLENEYLKVLLNDRGEIVSLWDKEASLELAAGPCNRFALYKDVPNLFDAWDIDSMAASCPVEIDEPVHLELLSSGPLAAQIRLSRKLHQSMLSQVITLRRGSRRVEFATEVDWQESHKLLKVCFPLDIHTYEAIHEIQFGHIRRPTHASHQFDADRFEVPAQKWSALADESHGAALLNDCKYGLSTPGSSLNLTLLKSALSPDMTADKGKHSFTYALYAWNGSFLSSGVVEEGYNLNTPVITLPGSGGEGSLFSVSSPNIIVDTVKPAEDGSRDVIVRLYEAYHAAAHCNLTTPLPVSGAWQTDMLENNTASLVVNPGANKTVVSLDFRPFEVKTIRLCIAE